MANLFIHILQFPNASSTNRDLALLEFGVGLLARVKFSLGYSYPCGFVKCVASLAQDFAENVGNPNGSEMISEMDIATITDNRSGQPAR